MQGQQIGWNPGYNGQSFNPAFNNGYPGQQQRQQPPLQHQQYASPYPPQPQQHQQQHQQKQQEQPLQPPQSLPPTTYQSKKFVAAPPLPPKPVEDQICKHGVGCTKASCPYSHPSPVATKDSGLVLSSEACEKQLLCTDKVRLPYIVPSISMTLNVTTIHLGLSKISCFSCSIKSTSSRFTYSSTSYDNSARDID